MTAREVQAHRSAGRPKAASVRPSSQRILHSRSMQMHVHLHVVIATCHAVNLCTIGPHVGVGRMSSRTVQ
eukprot:10282561-Alexandrium_andersonii.AAC.1